MKQTAVDRGIIMKKFLITFLLIQILLICVGIWQLTTGKIGFGLFNIIVNTFGYLFNISLYNKIQINKIKNK
jgi:hypothetical protein